MGTISLQRILLADDEPDILEISKIALESVGGYEVAVCGTGRELLDLLPDVKPDLIIVDVLMPGMSGPEVFDELRRMPEYAPVPVVYLTGVIAEHEIKALLDSGVADVILKPFDPMTLADRVSAIWRSVDGQ